MADSQPAFVEPNVHGLGFFELNGPAEMFTFSVVRSFEHTVSLVAVALDPGKILLNTQPPKDQLFGGICSPVQHFLGRSSARTLEMAQSQPEIVLMRG
jgi:hypothetical protein